MIDFKSMTLKKRFFGMVALLLLTEVIFVGILWLQLKGAEQELLSEKHAKDIYRKSQALVYQLSDYETELEKWVKHHDLAAETNAEKITKKMREDMKWLKENVKDNAKLSAEVAGLSDLQERMFKIVARAKEILGRDINQMQLLALGQRLKEKADVIRHDWEHSSVNLLKNEEGLLDTFPELQQRRRKILSAVVWCGTAGNIIVVFIFAFFFVRNISRKLNLMVDNTRLLSAKQPMHERIPGNDELARLDKSLHEMSESMEAAQKERQAFLAMVSHELRTPLMAVTATFELLSGGVLGELDEKARNCSEASDRKLQHLLSRINDLLDLEKLEAGKLSLMNKSFYLEIALDKVIEQVSDLLRERQVSIKTCETDIEILGDPDRIAQIIRNLLLNAIQASSPGSIVELECEEIENELELRVLDRGCGVKATLAGHLFERFRKDGDSDSLVVKGMGLPLARKLAEAHKGTVEYAPRPDGDGSIFSLRLPK